MGMLTETFEENINKICDKIIERKKISKVIRLSHEEMVLIRWAVVYALHNSSDKKINEALEIVAAKVYRYE